MNNTIDNTPDNLQEKFHLMLMTLEYGGSVNTKYLDELEKQWQEAQSKMSSTLNS